MLYRAHTACRTAFIALLIPMMLIAGASIAFDVDAGSTIAGVQVIAVTVPLVIATVALGLVSKGLGTLSERRES